jgi:hypothetical protein
MAIKQCRITYASVLITSSTYTDEGFVFGSSTAESIMLLLNKVLFHDVLTPYLGIHNITQEL